MCVWLRYKTGTPAHEPRKRKVFSSVGHGVHSVEVLDDLEALEERDTRVGVDEVGHLQQGSG